MSQFDKELRAAAQQIDEADALLIGAGAGMGVDSGLPDFRGAHGFWRAYPPYAKLGLTFAELANPHWFNRDPTLAWGFYGHRYNLYRSTRPHDGFGILRSWAERKKRGAFVFTSNVDEHFQRAGLDSDRVLEVHGSIEWLQCTRNCDQGIFPAADLEIIVDEVTMRAREPLPVCPNCGSLARPNILMFGDWGWDEARTARQQQRLEQWLESVGSDRLAVIECGAGTAIPTVRRFCEQIAEANGASLIRVNVREAEVPAGHISLPLAVRAALLTIDKMLRDRAKARGGNIEH
jgi:NAD-dependent SIR2 family protein deacetylase